MSLQLVAKYDIMDIKVSIKISSIFPFIAFFPIYMPTMQKNVSAFIFFTDISSIIPAFEKYTASQDMASMFWHSQSFTEGQRILSVLLRGTYMRTGKNRDT